jgi:iron-sulfur cluster repair protein YtfE (RIC family)
MLDTLPRVAHQHHAALLPHVDALATIAESIGKAPSDEIKVRVAAEHRFIIAQLVPHMEQAEATLYPQLERLLQNRHSMTPMRREHVSLRQLIDELGQTTTRPLGFGEQLRLRRLLYRLFSLLKSHLAEEEAYIDVLRGNLSADEAEALAQGLAHAMSEPI